MVSQFVSPDNVGLLGDLNYDFPEGIHAIGRLDNHSEGLLILTTNKKVTRLLFQGLVPHTRTYLVKVNKQLTPQNLELLRTGVTIRIKGGENYVTTPCVAEIVQVPDIIQPLPHQYDVSPYEAHTWLTITLTEGKFHQVRKMIKAIRHRCQRLIRLSIEDMELGDLQPGGVREIDEANFFRQLKITNWEEIQ